MHGAARQFALVIATVALVILLLCAVVERAPDLVDSALRGYRNRTQVAYGQAVSPAERAVAAPVTATVTLTHAGGGDDDPTGLVTILDWTGFFGRPLSSTRGNASLRRRLCGGRPPACRWTRDRAEQRTAHMLLFHLRDLHANDPPAAGRSPRQIYTMLSWESPHNAGNPTALRQHWSANYFNWSMSYRRDSDIAMPYFAFVPIASDGDEAEAQRTYDTAALLDIAARKSRPIAWFVSNCNSASKRERYVYALKRHISVDIYGDCGEFKCAKKEQRRCDAILKRDYYFYIAMENSVCKDYVTEKFAKITNFVVPIVFNDENYVDRAPPHSYIAAGEHVTPQSLAEHLRELMANASAYVQYFDWMRHYTLDEYTWEKAMCELCARLHGHVAAAAGGNASRTSYGDMAKWWIDEAKCERDYANVLLGRARSPYSAYGNYTDYAGYVAANRTGRRARANTTSSTFQP